MTKLQNGYVIYRGPSLIDGAPIVMIATGFRNKTDNEKTGAMIQTWILREDINPNDAVHSGKDYTICGNCKHRGFLVGGKNKGRTCYVNVWQAPNVVWKAYKRGIYEQVSYYFITNLFYGKLVRGGSYGDPAAVPSLIWSKIFKKAKGWTGYTHAWHNSNLRIWFMASVDNERERVAAKALGYRTFRIRTDETDRVMNREIVCPASKEAGFKTTCSACKACAGISAKAKCDIAIIDHGQRLFTSSSAK